jgi:2-polyprenyl-6-methoxyphenol hydroxylase-like FAD-dependent oxidoreductase
VDPDVIIVGAGPTALTLACALQAAGVGVRVLDVTAGPAVTSRLYAELGPRWALLGPQPLADTAHARLGDVVALCDDGRDATLVRPDGHIAWRGDDAGMLGASLDRVLGRRTGVLAQ